MTDEYLKQVNYKQIESELNTFEGGLAPQLQDVFAGAKDKLKALVKRRIDSGGMDFKFIEGLELRGLGDMVPLLRSYLQSVYHAGHAEAAREITRWRRK